MLRIFQFYIAIAVAHIVIGINTPLALADSFTAATSIHAGGCSESATLTEPGSIQLACGSFPNAFATFSGNLGPGGGSLYYQGASGLDHTMAGINMTIDIQGDISPLGNSGTSTIDFGFVEGFSQQAPVSCSLIFDGQQTTCTLYAPFGALHTEDFQFVVLNGQTYDYDLHLSVNQYYPFTSPGYASFQYSVPFVASTPEPFSLALVLSGCATLAFRRKHSMYMQTLAKLSRSTGQQAKDVNVGSQKLIH